MARCGEWPCCGHESGCCPDYDPETGEQLNMKCVCGATVPLSSPVSLCEFCLDPAGTLARRRIERSNAEYATCEACVAPLEGGVDGVCGGCHNALDECQCEWCGDCERCYDHCTCNYDSFGPDYVYGDGDYACS